MATAQAALTPTANTAPAIVSIPAKELSGAQWCARFAGSADIADLVEPFRTNVNTFFGAIYAAGGTTTISATYRPPERAHLMHYSAKLANGDIRAASIPAKTGVNIEWVHPTEDRSIAAAAAMTAGYSIVYPPALSSKHTRRTAIDVTIHNMIGKMIINATEATVTISRLADLNPVGASFGVIKLVSDRPHWSDDGH
jgi:D-alanyl-D-alanine dipeptidase